MRGIDADNDQLFTRRSILEVDVGLLSEELFFFIQLDKPIEADFLWPVFRGIFPSPRAIAFFQSQAHQRT